MRFGDDSDTHEVLQQGLQAFEAEVAVMFVDIRGFTNWSAEKSPNEVVAVLDRELELITRIINSNGGRVNKIMGDGLLAYFPQYKLTSCVSAATEIQQAVSTNNMLPVGVGCDFGEVIMGDLGQEARLDYTLIGSVVNFGARMCDSAREGQIAMTKRLFEQLDDDQKRALSKSYSETPIKVKVKPKDPEIEGILLS